MRQQTTLPPPGEADIYHSTYRWLTKIKAVEGYAREALELLETIIRRHGQAGGEPGEANLL